MSDDFFAAPAFKADEALQRGRRDLRELGLAEREGRFERRGLLIARLAVDDGRTPEWTEKTLRSNADLRDFVAHLKRQLATWSDRDE
jgi:hypothetical protein